MTGFGRQYIVYYPQRIVFYRADGSIFQVHSITCDCDVEVYVERIKYSHPEIADYTIIDPPE
jgi:hypothetical protein